jgi:hypothetical protein
MLFSLLFRFAFYGLFRGLCGLGRFGGMFVRLKRRSHLCAAFEAEKHVVRASEPIVTAIHIFTTFQLPIHAKTVA